MQIVDMHLVAFCLEAKIIARTVAHATLNSPAGKPHHEAVRVVITTTSIFADGGSSEFATPNYKGFLKQSSGL